WLTAYADLPEAETIYDVARRLPGAKAARLTHPTAETSGGVYGYGYNAASGFRAHEHIALKQSVAAAKAERRVESAMRRGDPKAARNLLQTALQQTSIPRAELVSLQSRLAASYFFGGDAAEARRLTDVSYMQDDSRSLWINGLADYKQGDYP